MLYVTEVYGWSIAMPSYRWEADEAALDEAAQAELAPALQVPAPEAAPSDKPGRWVQAGWRQVRYHSFLHNTQADAQYRQTQADASEPHFAAPQPPARKRLGQP